MDRARERGARCDEVPVNASEVDGTGRRGGRVDVRGSGSGEHWREARVIGDWGLGTIGRRRNAQRAGGGKAELELGRVRTGILGGRGRRVQMPVDS